MGPDNDLRNLVRVCARKLSLSLINLPSSLFDPDNLFVVIGLMIDRERVHFLPAIPRKNCARISNIYGIAHVPDDDSDDCAGSRFIDYSFGSHIIVPKALFGFLESVLNGFFGVPRESRLANDELMEVVSKKVSAASSSMAIINTEERAFWPIF